ncbi:OmpA family protein [Niastella sp. OAS944]|uniref:OmpA family protein n=1 Tax=Niastella sp. OAS944 TaxID=2664089 RepID=UPI0034931B3D|nr:outer membrane protein OmpA-like peptidoglycan-associated protein/tetratricopeptide (TPR) repeat protein [Chitinophagaceae bacterium OAS944]
MIKHIIIISGLAVSLTATQAQYVKNYKKAADKFYKQGDYNSAAQYYEKSLAGNKEVQNGYAPYQVEKIAAGSTARAVNPKVELLHNLADCYFKLQDYSHAETYYKEVIDLDATAYPNALYEYAICLRANGKYNLAEQQLEKYLKTKPAADYKAKATQELANCNFIQQQLQQGTGNVKVEKLNTQVNKEGASYAAAWMNTSTLVFTATRGAVDEHSKMTEYNNALYTTAQSGGSFAEAQKLPVTGNIGTHQGVASFTPDGKKMFFTGWNTAKDGTKTFAIYSTEQTANGWLPAVLVDGTINTEGADARQPHVTADGKYLLFSSNRNGGQGGYDIWYAPLKDGKPGKAMNMGASVNSKEDDGAPFYYAAGNTLVFASKGRVGMGGFDLFGAKGTPGSKFEEAVNLGYPVNSVKNDNYFVNRGKNLLEDAIISTDRGSLCCLELFAVHKNYNQYFAGQIIDCESKTPVAGVTITATNTNGQPVARQTTNAEGYYVLETEAGKEVKLFAGKEAYKNEALASVAASSDTINVGQSCLTKIPDPFKGQETLVTHDIRFGYNEKEVAPDSYGYMNDMVAYLKANPNVRLEISAHTDGIGSSKYNQELSQARADACVAYLVNASIDANRLMAKGYGATKPLEKEKDKRGKDIPAAREKNRRVEFKIVK